jgi:hypothetical protein
MKGESHRLQYAALPFRWRGAVLEVLLITSRDTGRWITAHREFLGSVVRYGVRVGDAEVIVDAPFRSGDELHEPGQPITIRIFLESALWLSS